jgi:predicted secreted acid phosphatase
MKRVFRLLMALLRELADESAYQRYLTANRRSHSGEEWRRFSEQRLRARFSGARCC